MKRLDKGTRSETTSVKGTQEREIENIHRKEKRISPQRSKRGSLHRRRSPSGRGKGLGYDMFDCLCDFCFQVLPPYSTFSFIFSA